eukprot:2556118-Prymnesium_polylepis.1
MPSGGSGTPAGDASEGEVAADRVAQEDHRLELELVPPRLDGIHEEVLATRQVAAVAVRQRPGRPAGEATAERVDRKDAAAPPLRERRYRRVKQSGTEAEAMHADQRWRSRVGRPTRVLDRVDVQLLRAQRRQRHVGGLPRNLGDVRVQAVPPLDPGVAQARLRIGVLLRRHRRAVAAVPHRCVCVMFECDAFLAFPDAEIGSLQGV